MDYANVRTKSKGVENARAAGIKVSIDSDASPAASRLHNCEAKVAAKIWSLYCGHPGGGVSQR